MSHPRTYEIRSGRLGYGLDLSAGIRLERLELESNLPWLDTESESDLFRLTVDGRSIGGRSKGLLTRDVVDDVEGGRRFLTARLEYEPARLEIEHHTILYAGEALLEQWVTIRNAGKSPVAIEQIDSICLVLPEDEYEILYYTSEWGGEFESHRELLRTTPILETKWGRSSKGMHPWFTLYRPGGGMLSGAVAWSGNWVVRFDHLDCGGYRLNGGLHDWEFWKTLEPGEVMESPPVIIALAQGDDLNAISTQYARVGRKHWYPRNALSNSLPTEWNHWFGYEDRHISEDVFKANVQVAATTGIDVCVLDAGWFGLSEPGTDWYDYRGDWDRVNTQRFPQGIRALSDYAAEHEMTFGIWCEIEGVGERSRLGDEHPEFLALRDGEGIGYLCMGNAAVRESAFQTLCRLITDYKAAWIKLDFNLDPGAGCNRTDHGHGAGDGLYEHYRGYYALLEQVREAHPQVILENCSSGGLRVDLGMMRRTHLTFLSDPDWPEHGLQLLWGATTMLAPDVCLHWGWSEWRQEHPYQTFNPRDPDLKEHQIDYYDRISMLGWHGYSQKLPDLPNWVRDRFAKHTAFYREHLRRFVRKGDVYRLTGQPKRGGRGDRWTAFQYSLPDRSEHMLFVFRLPGAEQERTIRLKALEPDEHYTLTWLDQGRAEEHTGKDLIMDGVLLQDLPEEGSTLISIRPARLR